MIMLSSHSFTMSARTLTYMLVICSLCSTLYAASYTDRNTLHADLFKDYNPNLRPVRDDAMIVNVTVDFIPLSLLGISEKDQTMTISGSLIIRWKDEILSWNSTAYNGVMDTKVQQKNIWKPDITILNTVQRGSNIGSNEMQLNIKSSGEVLWIPNAIFVTSCELCMTYYPFDIQQCQMNVALLMSDNTDIRLNTGQENSDLTFFSKNGQWKLLSAKSSKEADSEILPGVTFNVVFQSLSQFYVLNVIIPVLLLSCVGPVVFALSAQSGEKMGYSVTILLAYTLLVTKISDTMPQTSVQIAIISVYLLSMVSISALSVVMSAIILGLHHRPETTKPNSKIQRITRVLRRILCFRDEDKQQTWVTRVNKERDDSTAVPESKKEHRRLNTAEFVVTWKVFAQTLDFTCFVFFTSATAFVTIPCLSVMVVKGAE